MFRKLLVLLNFIVSYCQWSFNFQKFKFVLFSKYGMQGAYSGLRQGCTISTKQGAVSRAHQPEIGYPNFTAARGTSSFSCLYSHTRGVAGIRQFLTGVGAIEQGVAPTLAPQVQALAEPATSEVLPQLEGAIPFQDQRLLGYFLRLDPSRFQRATSEDAQEFLTVCMEGSQAL